MTMITFLLCGLIEPPQSVPATPLVPMKSPGSHAFETTEATSTFSTAGSTPEGRPVVRRQRRHGVETSSQALLEKLGGEAVDINNNQGKVMVIDFGQRGVAHVGGLYKNVELANKYKDQPFVLIGIHDARRGKERIEQVVGPLKADYPMAVDVLDSESKSGRSAQACRLKYWPTYLVVDHKGIVRACGLQPSRVEDVIKRLLKEIPQESPAEVKPTSDPS